jgi:hypothetical protein
MRGDLRVLGCCILKETGFFTKYFVTHRKLGEKPGFWAHALYTIFDRR